MKFSVSRESFLKSLQLVVGVVERKQTLPILSNVLLKVSDAGEITLTGTDLEVEIIGRGTVESVNEAGEITVPGRKLLDITRALGEDAMIQFSVTDAKALVTSGRSRFTLTTLPANEFPSVDEGEGKLSFSMPQKELKQLIDQTSFAMAQQDVRYYLNGMLLEASDKQLRTVATDGHRLAMSTRSADVSAPQKVQVIVPRKGVVELSRLLGSEDDAEANVVVGSNHLRIVTESCCFTSKLVDGNYPDYDRVLPRGGENIVEAARDDLKLAFGRASILSNEKYRGVRLILSKNTLKLVANNPEQEEAEEELQIDYNGSSFEVGFNVGYLLDVMNVLNSEKVRITLTDANSSALIEDPSEENQAVYVVMPMRL